MEKTINHEDMDGTNNRQRNASCLRSCRQFSNPSRMEPGSDEFQTNKFKIYK